MERYEVYVRGRHCRRYVYEDVAKARALIRRKAKDGFCATDCVRYRTHWGFVTRVILSCEPPYPYAGCTCFWSEVAKTPGYQCVVRGGVQVDDRADTLDYHGRFFQRKAVA